MDHAAKLKSAVDLRDAGRVSEATDALEEIVANYPDSSSAELAAAHLYNLRSGGQPGSDDGESLSGPASGVILTTSHQVAGYIVLETLEIITAECAFGMNVFHDIAAGLRDIFGGRSGSVQHFLRKARITCLNELKREAANLEANGVISVSLNYSEISGGGKSMLFLVASGTAVRLTREASQGNSSAAV